MRNATLPRSMQKRHWVDLPGASGTEEDQVAPVRWGNAKQRTSMCRLGGGRPVRRRSPPDGSHHTVMFRGIVRFRIGLSPCHSAPRSLSSLHHFITSSLHHFAALHNARAAKRTGVMVCSRALSTGRGSPLANAAINSAHSGVEVSPREPWPRLSSRPGNSGGGRATGRRALSLRGA